MNDLLKVIRIIEILDLDKNNDIIEECYNCYNNIQEAQIKTIREVHIEYKNALDKLECISEFINNFRYVISLNYDLLVYWSLMYYINKDDDSRYNIVDCFTNDNNGDFVFDQKFYKNLNNQNNDTTFVFYPHGNLMLAKDNSKKDIKITKCREKVLLLNQISKKWEENFTPLIVSEGNLEEKLNTIRSSTYLSFIYDEVLSNLGNKLIIYGWSLDHKDKHLIDRIFCNSDIEKVYISIYTNRNKEDYVEDQNRILKIIKQSKNGKAKDKDIDIKFFNADSKNCWCH